MENQKINHKKLHVLLFLMMIIDFIFTFIGINIYEIIEEGNILLIWLFKMPFPISFLIRIGFSLLLIYLCEYIYESNYKYYKQFIYFAIGINTCVILIHFKWIIALFFYMLYSI